MLRTALLAAAREPRVRHLVEANPLTRPVVDRYIAGTTAQDAVRTTRALADHGLHVTLDHLGRTPPTRTRLPRRWRRTGRCWTRSARPGSPIEPKFR